MEVTLGLDEQTAQQLDELGRMLGFSAEYAAIYAIRLVGACLREGLLFDTPACIWPEEARLLTDSSNNVLSFPGAQGE